MQKYLLSEPLHQLLKRHSSVFPAKRAFQSYVKNVLRSRFSSDSYTDARNRRPTQHQFLVNLIVYLKDKESPFIAKHLGEDWHTMSVDQIARQHIVVAPDDYIAPARSSDTFKLGPTQLAADLFARIHDDGHCRPARFEDIDLLVEQFMLGVGDSYNLDFTPPTDEAKQEGIEKSGFSQQTLSHLFHNAIQYCENSVWIRPDSKQPDRTLISIIAPVREQEYKQFLAGEIDEAEVFSRPPCRQASYIILISMLGHARHNGWLAKGKAKTDLMFMLWRQVGLVSSDVLANGLKLLTFNSTEMNGKRLQGWGFKDTGQKMKRTGFPLMQLELAPGGRKPGDKIARYVWPIVIVFQTLGVNKPIAPNQ